MYMYIHIYIHLIVYSRQEPSGPEIKYIYILEVQTLQTGIDFFFFFSSLHPQQRRSNATRRMAPSEIDLLLNWS